MDTMLNALSVKLEETGVTFDPYNDRVRCLAHIIDLSAKKALNDVRGSGPESESDVLEEDDTEEDLRNGIYKVVSKVNLFCSVLTCCIESSFANW
jgi:hypothetical protein